MLHLFTCHGRIMPRLAELLCGELWPASSLCKHWSLLKTLLQMLSSMMKTSSETFLHIYLVNNGLKWQANKRYCLFFVKKAQYTIIILKMNAPPG